MGTGIGIVASRVLGANVKFVDATPKQIEWSKQFVSNWCDKEIKKERLDEAGKKDLVGRISYHESISSLNDIDFSVEVRNEK